MHGEGHSIPEEREAEDWRNGAERRRADRVVDVARVDDSHEQVGVGSREKRRRNLDQSEKGICFELNGVVGGRGVKLLSSKVEQIKRI